MCPRTCGNRSPTLRRTSPRGRRSESSSRSDNPRPCDSRREDRCFRGSALPSRTPCRRTRRRCWRDSRRHSCTANRRREPVRRRHTIWPLCWSDRARCSVCGSWAPGAACHYTNTSAPAFLRCHPYSQPRRRSPLRPRLRLADFRPRKWHLRTRRRWRPEGARHSVRSTWGLHRATIVPWADQPFLRLRGSQCATHLCHETQAFDEVVAGGTTGA